MAYPPILHDGELRIWISVRDGKDTVSIHTRAQAVGLPKVEALVDKAIAALQAERDAMRACPVHTKAKKAPRG